MNVLLAHFRAKANTYHQFFIRTEPFFQLISICIARDIRNLLFRFRRMKEKSTSKIKCYQYVYIWCTNAVNSKFLFSRSHAFCLNHINFQIQAIFQTTRKKRTTRDMKKTKLFLFTWMPWHAAETSTENRVYLEERFHGYCNMNVFGVHSFTLMLNSCYTTMHYNTEAPINVHHTFNNRNYLVLYIARTPFYSFVFPGFVYICVCNAHAYTQAFTNTVWLCFYFIISLDLDIHTHIDTTLFAFYWWYLIFLEYIKFLALFIKWNGTTTEKNMVDS